MITMIQNPTVFYADDDQEDREFFEYALKNIDSKEELYLMEDGQALLDVLNDPPPTPNIVFLDLNMPGKNGFMVLSEIRAIEKFKNLPVVIFSTSNDDVLIDKSFTLGASLYITKPLGYDDLLSLLRQVFRLDWLNHLPNRDTFVLSA